MKRLHNLDYLRALAAFGIMMYHYLVWSLGHFPAENVIERIGIYGVSIFYVLSGLTLYFVYYEQIKPSKQDIASFFKKRFLRIFPLLYLVTFTAILLYDTKVDFSNLFLNLTGLFGFVSWDKYYSPGIWSIGNELVFYVFFPFFILFTKKYRPMMVILSLVLFALYIYFSWVKLVPGKSLSQQWSAYTNPLNQVFLFLGGFLIGYIFQNLKIKNGINISLLICAAAIFCFYPVEGERINLVLGMNRLLFTCLCFLTCICFFRMTFRFPKFIHQPLTVLGAASYSIYLLHPIIWNISGRLSNLMSDNGLYLSQMARILSSVIATIVTSYYVHHYFERYFIRMGRPQKDNPVLTDSVPHQSTSINQPAG